MTFTSSGSPDVVSFDLRQQIRSAPDLPRNFSMHLDSVVERLIHCIEDNESITVTIEIDFSSGLRFNFTYNRVT